MDRENIQEQQQQKKQQQENSIWANFTMKFNKYTLAFNDENLKNAYEEFYFKSIQKKVFSGSQLTSLILLIIAMIQLLKLQQFNHALIGSSPILIIIPSYFIGTKFQKLIPWISFINAIIMMIFNSINIFSGIINLSEISITLSYVYQGQCILFSQIFFCNCSHNMIFKVSMLTVTDAILTGIGIYKQQTIAENLIVFVGVLITKILAVYFISICFRESFFSNHHKSQELKKFKEILDQKIQTGFITIKIKDEEKSTLDPSSQQKQIQYKNNNNNNHKNQEDNNIIDFFNNNELENDTLDIIYCNKAIEKMFGKEKFEICKSLKAITFSHQNLTPENMLQNNKIQISIFQNQQQNLFEFLKKQSSISNQINKFGEDASVFYNCQQREEEDQESADNSDNKVKVFELTVSKINWDGTPCLLVLISDISLDIQFQKLKQIHNEKDKALVHVTHDLKGPISGIIAISEVIESCSDIVLMKQNVQIIQKASKMLMCLVHDILDSQKLKNNKIILNAEYFDLYELIIEIKDILLPQILNKNLKINIFMHPEFESFIYNDQMRLKQVLMNLVGNAIKFTSSGFINIIIEHNSLDQNLLVINVIDSGMGIPQNIQNQLFKEYSTFSRGQKVHGTGLGLIICQKLVGLLGPIPKIELFSQPNVGSQFSFLIYRNFNKRLEQKLSQQQIQDFNDQSPKKKNEISIIIEPSSEQEIEKQQNQQQSQQLLQLENKKQQINNFIEYEFYNHLSENATIQKDIIENKIESRQLIPTSLQFKSIYDKQSSLIVNSDHSNLLKQINQQQQDLETNNNYQQSQIIFENQEQAQHLSLQQSLINLDQQNYPQQDEKNNENDNKKSVFSKIIKIDYISIIKKVFNYEKKRFLIVDDQIYNIIPLKHMLGQIPNCELEEAHDGQEAVDKIKIDHKSFDFIFMDVSMPKLNGMAASKQIKQYLIQQQLPDINITLLTGGGDNDNFDECLKISDADHYVLKPISIKKMIKILSNNEESIIFMNQLSDSQSMQKRKKQNSNQDKQFRPRSVTINNQILSNSKIKSNIGLSPQVSKIRKF